MRTLFNQTAFKLTLGYVVLVVILLIVTCYTSDSEGRIFDYFVIGFPWILNTQNDSVLGTALFVILDSLSVYTLTLIVVESLSNAD
ncbi:MAG: hypothetical protein WA197_18340 [Candidatus Acidiferrales bacterium]